MLVSGDVKKKEYLKLVELIDKIDKDSFCKNYFAGITKKMEISISLPMKDFTK
jgi:cell division protein FtsQ